MARFEFGPSGIRAMDDNLDEAFYKSPKKVIVRYEKADAFYGQQ